MFDDYHICPYTGLRPFTEEESLYFKGRDEHIDQATKQLGENKFLILTGASGDGKSSLVYAGIIPNAKAGFLKSTYNNWVIADFRPERSPLDNFSSSIAEQLGIKNIDTVKTELSHGYSSLIDLYKASKLYIDRNDPDWINGDDSQKNVMKRNAANLLIVADQFEEFFTNPENYQNGVPSTEANLVTNLLLETARIALEENLPIYVIITMRSDFIGQCASFRGLPEYIGFSQFFVPRLNRKQLMEVIEEPALLSGNQISRRLTERLILDIVEGTDQLPILQHALNQVWKMADEGKVEMDLVHYAMVGGMDSKELPEADQGKFSEWFMGLSDKIKECYQNPSLQNVLNTHANKLHNVSYDSLEAQDKEILDEEDAKLIIKTTFKCLTKIDSGRAVRNRMTLGEITSIINLSGINYGMVGKVLGVYRETGNTLLRPFVEEGITLDENTVLDITHESLIRNWEFLDLWANEEYDNYTTYLDFKQQMDRWVESGKSNSFLLYIGPLTYFENWFNLAKPNTAWIARYLDNNEKDENQKKAEEILGNSNEFIARSASKHVVTRTVMRYGPKKIAAVFGLIAILVLSSFMVKNYVERQNTFVLDEIVKQSIDLAGNKKVEQGNKISLLAEALKGGNLTLQDIGNAVESEIDKVDLVSAMGAYIVLQGMHEPQTQIFECIKFADSLLTKISTSTDSRPGEDRILKEINDLHSALELAYFYNQKDELFELLERNAERSAEWSLFVLESQPAGFSDMTNLNLAIENALNYAKLSNDQINRILNIISPFEKQDRSAWVLNNFSRDKLLNRGAQDYGFKFNGLYHELAHLYAANGQIQKTLACVDSLIKYNDNYYTNKYESNADNATNIAATYYLNGKENEMQEFIDAYAQKAGISTIKFYEYLLGNSIPTAYFPGTLNIIGFLDMKYNLNLQAGKEKQRAFFYDQYRIEINAHARSDNEKNFLLALSYKNQGIHEALQRELSDSPENSDISQSYFDRAFQYYREVDMVYLDEDITVSITGANDVVTDRGYLFLYPDIRIPFQPLEPRAYYFYFYSGEFLNYILDNDLFDVLYRTDIQVKYIEDWLRNYNSNMWAPDYFVRRPIQLQTFEKLEAELIRRNSGDFADLNLLYLYLSSEYGKLGNIEKLQYCHENIHPNNFNNLFNYRAFNNQINFHSFYLLATHITNLAHNGLEDDVDQLINSFNNPTNRSILYAFVSKELSFRNAGNPLIRQYIDSSYHEISRIDNLTTGQPNRVMLAYAHAMQNTGNDINEAFKVIKNVPFKFVGNQRICRSLAYHNSLYEATQRIPKNISDNDQSIFLWNILYGYNLIQDNIPDNWDRYNQNYAWFETRLIIYLDDNG